MWSKPPGRRRSSSPFHKILRPLLLHIFTLECAAFVFLMYLKPTTSFGSGLVKILAPNDQVNRLFSNESNKGVTSVLIYNLNVGTLLCNIKVSTSLTTRTRTRSLIGSSFTMDTHPSRGQLQRPTFHQFRGSPFTSGYRQTRTSCQESQNLFNLPELLSGCRHLRSSWFHSSGRRRLCPTLRGQHDPLDLEQLEPGACEGPRACEELRVVRAHQGAHRDGPSGNTSQSRNTSPPRGSFTPSTRIT